MQHLVTMETYTAHKYENLGDEKDACVPHNSESNALTAQYLSSLPVHRFTFYILDLMQHYLSVSECKTTVVNTDPRSVTLTAKITHYIITMFCVENMYLDVNM